jgi:hypothetical protein
MLTNLGPAMEIMKKSGKKDLPVIDIDGTIIIGPDQSAINKALGL